MQKLVKESQQQKQAKKGSSSSGSLSVSETEEDLYSPSTSCQFCSNQVSAASELLKRNNKNRRKHPDLRNSLIDKQDDIQGRQYNEDSNLLSSSLRSQTSVDFEDSSRSNSRSHFARSKSSCNESRRLINRSFCCCCITSGNNNTSSTIMSASTKLALSYFIAEVIGTFLLVLIGDGVVASYAVTVGKVDVFNACLGFGVGAMIASFAVGKISGAHINPAATLAFALDGKVEWRFVPIYMIGQYFGGFLAALTLYVNYVEAIDSLDGGLRQSWDGTNSTAGIFVTFPAKWVSVWGSLIDQIVGTAVLLFSISAVSDKSNLGLDEKHQPLVVAFVIGLVCAAFSPNCGALFNPARDIAPRILTTIVGYPADVWTGPLDGWYWIAAGLVGPHVGAILGYFAYKFLVGGSLVNKRQYELEEARKLNASSMEKPKFVSITHHHHHHHQQPVGGFNKGNTSSGCSNKLEDIKGASYLHGSSTTDAQGYGTNER